MARKQLQSKTLQASSLRTLRASSAPIFADCPAAAHGYDDPIVINRSDEAGTLGTAVHEACALIARGKTVDAKKLGTIARKYGLPDTRKREMETMAAVAQRFWREYGHCCGEPRCIEVEWTVTDRFHQVRLTGREDVAGQEGDISTVVDWKTTRLEDTDYHEQMMQYLWLAAYSPDSPYSRTGYRYTIVFLRDQTIINSDVYQAEDLYDWMEGYLDRVLQWDGRTYNPGRNCHYCPRFACCPGRAEMVKAEFSAACSGDGLSKTIDNLTPAQCVAAYERFKAVEGFVGEAVDRIKELALAEGSLQGDGKALVVKEQRKKEILAKPAWPVLKEYLSNDELAPCVKIGKTRVEQAVADKAPHGQKGRVKKRLLEELEAAGAIKETVTPYVTLVKTLPATESEMKENSDEGQE